MQNIYKNKNNKCLLVFGLHRVQKLTFIHVHDVHDVLGTQLSSIKYLPICVSSSTVIYRKCKCGICNKWLAFGLYCRAVSFNTHKQLYTFIILPYSLVTEISLFATDIYLKYIQIGNF